MKHKFNFVLALVLMVAFTLGVSGAQAVDPMFVPGNPTCSDFGDWIEYKIDDPMSGNYSDGTLDVFVQIHSTVMGTTFDFLANQNVYAVVAKGGPNANLYKYADPVREDTGLHAPINKKNNKYYGLSHISFCYKPALMVVKDAQTTFKRTYEWDITKDVTPAAWNLFRGDSGTSEYTVAVEKTGFTDSEWAVAGSIHIYNPAKIAATITGVVDVVSPDISALVSCPVDFPYDLPAGGLLTCTYSADLPDAETRSNTATATTTGMVDGDNGFADVVFDLENPTVEVNKEINVTDTNGTSWGPVSDDSSWKYEKTFECDADEGKHENTAAIVETGQSDDAEVNVDCYALNVTKDAATSLTRTWNWTIDKSVDPADWHLFVGDSGTSLYTVAVDKTGYTDSAWAVAGKITVSNPAPMTAKITAVTDVISPDTAAEVDCAVTFPYDLPAGGSLECTYTAALPDGASRTNTATATLQNYDYDKDAVGTASGTTAFTGEAAVSFADPVITTINPSINVTDTNGMAWGPVSDDTTWTYPKTFECDADEGKHENTAAIVQTGQSDDAEVNVACYELNVTKDAQPTYSRKWTWDIDKVGDKTDLTSGDTFTVNYDVTVSATSVDSKWAVGGKIYIYNPAPIAAELTAVTDIVSPAIAANVVCPALTVPAGQTLTCTYATNLPDAASRTNTATATLQNYDYDKNKVGTKDGTTSWFGNANVVFSGPTQEIDECVEVSDDKYGYLGQVCANGNPFSHTFEYPLNIPVEVCGDYYFTNTAKLVTNDTLTEDEDSWTVHVYLPCEEQTAFALGNSCFLNMGFDRWGWTNGPIGEGMYEYPVYAGAAQCDTTKGTYVGTVKVTYSGGTVSVQFMLESGFTLVESHVYAGYTPVPVINGSPTVAPGQYYITPNLTGDIYVIVHGVVAGSFK